jgi:hypothetical protein
MNDRLLSTALRISGLDTDIFYTILIRVWGIIKSPFSILFLITYLTPIEQGYWYSFISLGALTAFAELGFTNIVTQFVSHEYAHLSLSPGGVLEGDTRQIERFSSLVRFALRVYLFISPFAFLILSVVGVFVLIETTSDKSILTAWIIYSLSGSLSLYVSLITAVVQGCNKVAFVQKMILIAGVFNTLLTMALLYFHFGIWALCFGALANIIVVIALIILYFGKFWSQVILSNVSTKFPWFKDILPLQIKYAVSWLAGYFIFYIFTPAALHFQGAVVAGQVGLSITLVRAISSLSSSFVSSKISVFNILVAKNEMAHLDGIFKGLQARSVIVLGFCSFVLISFSIYILPMFKWQHRLLPTFDISLLAFSELCVLIISNYAIYLRAFKQEPFMWLSVGNGIGCLLAIVGGLFFFKSVNSAVILYSIIQVGIVVWARVIFIKFREKAGILHTQQYPKS